MIIVEYISDGYKHADVNAAMISIYIKKNPDEKIHLFCADLYFEILTEIMKKNSVECENLVHHSINSYRKQVRDYKMFLFDLGIVSSIFKWAKNNNETEILFLYTTTFMLYFTKLFAFLNKKINICSVIHGDLERIMLIEYANSFESGKLWQYLYALIFGLKLPLTLPAQKNLKHIVYSESIKSNMLSVIPKLKNNVSTMPYPYFYEKLENTVPFRDNKVHFCVPGLSSARKNLPVLKQLINFFDNVYSENPNFELSFGGIIMDKEFYNSMIMKDYTLKKSVSDTMLSSEYRDNLLKQADYALITYQFNSYKLIANGSFMDSINMETPVIATRNNYIEQYFKKYGNIGYIVDSYRELEEKVKEILNNPPIEEYQIQKENIRKIKADESIENTVKLLEKGR